ncbi:ACOT13, partial [Symbiodinium sp. CCMP2456]
VSFFSLSKVDGPLYAEVKKVVSHQREELMFQMLTVPDSKVKIAALECVGTANVADTSTSEVETLIGFLDVKGEDG